MLSMIKHRVIGRNGNILVVDFSREPNPPAPRFPGSRGLREPSHNKGWTTFSSLALRGPLLRVRVGGKSKRAPVHRSVKRYSRCRRRSPMSKATPPRKASRAYSLQPNHIMKPPTSATKSTSNRHAKRTRRQQNSESRIENRLSAANVGADIS